MKVCIITLGCDKNRCDSEIIAAYFVNMGYAIIAADEDADIIVINTCAFINSARRESVNAITDRLKYINKKIIVCGCLVEKHRAELEKDLPEVTAFCTIKDFSNKNINKLLSSPKSYVYIKIAEGCNNSCSFCTIPNFKGKYTARADSDIINEIKHFAGIGVGEFILVAQDVTSYPNLVRLLKDITQINGVRRIRLHYCYPNKITDELINEVAVNDKICKYLDIPFQHCNQRILKSMNRRGSVREYTELIKKIRAKIPNITIRSTFMVGFPTETDDEFSELIDFIKDVKLDYVGFFIYSREEGTTSYNMKQVPARIKNIRLKLAEKVQASILKEKNEKMIGKTIKIIWDGKNGRTPGQSPDVDTYVLVKDDNLEIGKEYTVKIIGVKKNNFAAELI
jgi:ribosomal protein S12 methylthiotransferase